VAGTANTKLTVEDRYDLLSFHGRVVWIVCLVVGDFNTLGLWFRFRYNGGRLGRREQTLTMAYYGLEVVKGVLALLRVRGGREMWGKETLDEAGTDRQHALSPNQAHLTKHSLSQQRPATTKFLRFSSSFSALFLV